MKTIYSASELDGFDLSTVGGRAAFAAHISGLNASMAARRALQANHSAHEKRFCAVAAPVAVSGGFPAGGCALHLAGARSVPCELLCFECVTAANEKLGAAVGGDAGATDAARSAPHGNHGDNDSSSGSVVVA